jgi:hypothetical protein
MLDERTQALAEPGLGLTRKRVEVGEYVAHRLDQLRALTRVAGFERFELA